MTGLVARGPWSTAARASGLAGALLKCKCRASSCEHAGLAAHMERACKSTRA